MNNEINTNIKRDSYKIDDLKIYEDINPNEKITSHRKIFRKLIIISKKIIRKLLKWYANPLAEKQSGFNSRVRDILEKLIDDIDFLENDVQIKQLKIEDLEIKVSKIKELEIKVSKIKELETKISKIEEIEEKLQKLEAIESKVDKIDETFKLELSPSSRFFDKKSYSQSGEDNIVAYILKYLAIDINTVKYLDLGANHAKEMNNTYYFYENGARGVLVEANPSLIPELHFYRYNDIVLNNLVSVSSDEEMEFYVLSGDGLSTPNKEQAEETCKINPAITIKNVVRVTSITVNDIIEKYFGGKAPNFMSIDIEGYDLEIIKSIDLEKYRPLAIIVESIEYRPYLPINVKVNNITEYLNTKDYAEYAFTGINSIFIDSRYMKQLNQDK